MGEGPLGARGLWGRGCPVLVPCDRLSAGQDSTLLLQNVPRGHTPLSNRGCEVRTSCLRGWGWEDRTPRGCPWTVQVIAGTWEHAAAQEEGRCSPSSPSSSSGVRGRVGASWLSTRPPVPLAKPGMPGTRRQWCSLQSEVWVSGSLGRVGGKLMPRAFQERTGCRRVARSFDGGPGSLGGMETLATPRACPAGRCGSLGSWAAGRSQL